MVQCPVSMSDDVCGGGGDDAEPPLLTYESGGEMMDDEQGSTLKVSEIVCLQFIFLGVEAYL